MKKDHTAEIQNRAASFIPESLDPEKRPIDVCWTTGATVRRFSWDSGAYNETLSTDPESVELSRLNSGAPVLNCHGSRDLSDQIGVVERAWMSDGKGFARLRLSSRKELDPLFQDIADGIIRNISVGYRVHRYQELKREKGETRNLLATSWEPMEISFVPVPADAGAGVRSEPERITMQEIEKRENKQDDKNPPPDVVQAPEKVRVSTEANADQMRSEARKLVSDIYALCERHGVDASLRSELTEQAVSLEEAGARILGWLGERSAPTTNPHNISFGRCEEDTRREAIPNAILHRHDPDSVTLSEAGREYRGMSLLDMARLYARVPHGRFTDKREIVTRAFSTSDFPELLGETAKRKILNSYENLVKLQSFQNLVTVRSLPDFKETMDIRLSDTPQFVELPEGSEYKYGYQDLTKEGWHLITYGRKMGISRQAVINDDLGAFDRLGNWGLAAARLEIFLFWNQFNLNQKMGDGLELFHKKHSNLEEDEKLFSGPSIPAISSARMRMRRQKSMEAEKDRDSISGVKTGRNLGLTPKYIIVPPELEEEAMRIVMPGLWPAKNEDKNPYQGAFEIIVGDELEDLSAWYMACDKSQGVDLIHMGYLDGIRAPFVEYKTDFETDQIAVKARMDIACRAKDWKGFWKNPGKKK